MQALSSEYRRRFLSRQLLFEKQYREVFENIADQFAELSQNPNAKFSRSFKFPEVINKRIEGIMTGFHEDLTRLTENEITQAWTIANEKNDKIVIQYLKTIHDIKASQKAAYFSPNISALSAFLSQKTGTESLSSMIWRVTDQARQEMEVHLGIGIANGDSASVISRRIRQYLNNPDALFRRVRDEKGKLIPSKRMSEYHPGQGVYKSSYKNAMRIARTETNMAYHASDNERWGQIDFVTGMKISLSAAHPVYNFPEICEVCAGVYPKDFVWTSWHSHCYSDDTEVMTVKGWKLFKDVKLGDEVFSLNKETKQLEKANVTALVSYPYKGEMMRFHNVTLDMLVTPDHNMVYLSKSKPDQFREMPACRYDKNKGGLFRSAKWEGRDQKNITIGVHEINFDLFCEFMGYYLADGSVSFTKKNEFNISQGVDHDVENRNKIKQCLDKMPLRYWEAKSGFGSTDPHFRQYLEQFGKALDKYIPQEIKDSSSRQINIFLDAFISCDGYIREPRSFIGNRGTKFIPKHMARTYYTSSEQMACDIGELLLKIGMRPSYYKTELEEIEFKNGIYKSQPSYKINECRGKSSTVFNKDSVYYDGIVYDIEVDRNHTLYVRRNGKCVWGSNCLCHATPVLTSKDDFRQYLKTGKKKEIEMITDYPDGFKYFVLDNYERFSNYKSVPYWFRDNLSTIDNIIKQMK